MFKNVWLNSPGKVIAFAEAVLALALAFGLQLTAEQVAGIIAVVTVGLGLFTDRVAVSREALDLLAQEAE